MRGLTAEERRLLGISAEVGDPEPDSPDVTEREYRILVALSAQQRVASRDLGAYQTWDATDLGRLAIRVCPVDE